MRIRISRRRLLEYAAAGISAFAAPDLVRAQSVTKPVVKDETFVATPVSIDVNARPIASFDPRDRSHVR